MALLCLKTLPDSLTGWLIPSFLSLFIITTTHRNICYNLFLYYNNVINFRVLKLEIEKEKYAIT